MGGRVKLLIFKTNMRYIANCLIVTLLVAALAVSMAPSQAIADTTVAEKYGLHSYHVQRLGGPVVSEYRSTTNPVAPASLLKPILADLAIRGNNNLSARLHIEAKHLYGCGLDGNYKVGQKMNLRTAIKRTLRYSDNVAANMLISFGGGIDAMNARVHGPLSGGGYRSTNIVSYYRCEGTNNTTSARDVGVAMQTIFNNKQERGYSTARSALKGAAKSSNYWNIPNAYANKYGATSQVSGNSAILKRDKKRYIVTVYINRGNAADDIRGATLALAGMAPQLDR